MNFYEPPRREMLIQEDAESILQLEAEIATLRESLFNLRIASSAYMVQTYGKEANRQFQAATCGNLAPSPVGPPATVETELIASGAAPPAAPLAPTYGYLPANLVLPEGMGPDAPPYPGSMVERNLLRAKGGQFPKGDILIPLTAEEQMAAAHSRDLAYLKAHPDFLSLVTDRSGEPQSSLDDVLRAHGLTFEDGAT